jgi:hypothetical protein
MNDPFQTSKFWSTFTITNFIRKHHFSTSKKAHTKKMETPGLSKHLSIHFGNFDYDAKIKSNEPQLIIVTSKAKNLFYGFLIRFQYGNL